MQILANFIACLHLLFIIFVVSTPFVTDNPFILLYYCFILFFVMVHWYLNNDTCVLTLIESKLRGKKDSETFMGRLLKPIYNVSSDEIKYFSLFLFLFAFLKIRIWEKERSYAIYKTIYIKYKLVYNKYYAIKNDEYYEENIAEARKYYLNEVADFLINPLKELNNSDIKIETGMELPPNLETKVISPPEHVAPEHVAPENVSPKILLPSKTVIE